MINKSHKFEDNTALIRACLNKDQHAWDYFVSTYSLLILNAIANRLRKYSISANAQEMKEIRQELFSSIWEHDLLQDIRNPESLRYWLAIMAGNVAIAHVRKRRRYEKVEIVSEPAKLCDSILQPKSSPTDKIAGKELSETIDMAIDSLPSKERLVIKLSLLYGKRYEEIADLLHIPIGSVATYVKRAKGKLQKILKKLK